jgi:lysozyme
MERYISEQGLALLKRFEGFSATPYLCPAGKWTIGYGHVIGAGEHFPPQGIDLDVAEELLKQDVNIAEHTVCRLVKSNITQNQFDALVSLVYNIGKEAFEKSALLRLLNQNYLNEAGDQFKRWIYAGGRQSEGLKRRRAAEFGLFSIET